MPRNTTIEYEGKQVAGRSMQFESTREIWNEYKLEDGAIVKIRVVPSDIIVTDQQTSAGEPVVVVTVGLLVQYLPNSEPSAGPQ